jgi:high-affinity nickel-transport protein
MEQQSSHRLEQRIAAVHRAWVAASAAAGIDEESNENLRKNLIAAASVVALLNVVAWAGALGLRTLDAATLGMAILAYFLGLRHAFDADHIASIDNVTRKLRQDGQRPAAVGLFFSLGHSTVVVLLSLGVVLFARAASSRMADVTRFGNTFGVMISAAFLTLIGLVNLYIFVKLWQMLARHRRGDSSVASDAQINDLLEQRGLLARIFRWIYRHIDRSWHMYPVGFLFGLGFDTATEIAIIGISAAMARRGGLPLWGVMVFPLLFTAGMTLMDTADGLAMLKIYDWAMMDHMRKLLFNTAITGLGVLVALVIGTIEWLQLLWIEEGWHGGFGAILQALDFSAVGGIVVVLMILVWLAAWFYYRRIQKVPTPAPGEAGEELP